MYTRAPAVLVALLVTVAVAAGLILARRGRFGGARQHSSSWSADLASDHRPI